MTGVNGSCGEIRANPIGSEGPSSCQRVLISNPPGHQMSEPHPRIAMFISFVPKCLSGRACCEGMEYSNTCQPSGRSEWPAPSRERNEVNQAPPGPAVVLALSLM